MENLQFTKEEKELLLDSLNALILVHNKHVLDLSNRNPSVESDKRYIENVLNRSRTQINLSLSIKNKLLNHQPCSTT